MYHSGWNTNICIIDGHEVVVKQHRDTNESIIIVPAALPDEKFNIYRKMATNYAGLTLGQFLIKMFGCG